ncbi:MAG: hypothetical protein V4456_00955 [Bacteroidota bacterium]|jgi:hypothetical protein|uniref:hypothetical protein n=1 Tax=Mucilaginibacter sp. TaxID=1882438 RepID=UPI003361CF93
MSNWKEEYKKDLPLFNSLKLLFENHAITRMYEIKDLYAGKIANALGINKGRYAQKLANPETFVLFEILRLAFIIDIDPNLIINVIQNEKDVMTKIIDRVKKDKSK